MQLTIPFFRGSRPKAEPHLLEMGEARQAVNCRVSTGALEPFRGSTTIRAISRPSVAALTRFGRTNHWLEFQNDVNVVEGPSASDTESTTYFTGDGVPAMTYATIATGGSPPFPAARYILGVPAPEDAPVLAVTGTATGGDETAEARVYVFTYVSARGEEGPPSPPTAMVDVLLGQSVSLTDIPTAPSGNYNITAKRIYRSASASGDASFLLVAEIPVAQVSYTDGLATESLGGILKSGDWYPPHAEMTGLISAGNGVLAGFYGKELFLSEPYHPHAWPYGLTMTQPIVGLVAVRGGLVVATTGQPVIVSFTHPGAASQFTIETARACVAKRSMVDMGDFAIFATGDGLVAVDGSGNAPLITQGVLDRYQWQRLNPHTMHAYRKENWYVCFYQGVAGNGGFAITAQGNEFIQFDFYATAGYSDPQTGDLYLVIGSNIVRWDDNAAALIPYVWRSGSVPLASPVNISCARIEATGYPLTFRLYDDDTDSLILTRTVSNSQPFWLPSSFVVQKYSVELIGTAKIKRVMLADSMEGLA